MILIVDDDRSVTTSLALLLKQAGYGSETASSPAEAVEKIEAKDCELVLQDMNFLRGTSGEEGLALLAEIRKRRPQIPVILMTAWGSIALAVKGIQAGAADFVTKPWSNQQLLHSVGTALGLAAALPHRQGPMPTREELDKLYDFSGIVGSDPKFLKALQVAGRVSATDASVLITGESGTGKEVVAEAIHRNSNRRKGPFVKVNLGGISTSLFESEMFGHIRGAFTDAHQARKGRFELADGGTIFLDEIGDLDSGSQVKMLRVLQDRSYEVLGSSVARTVDLRVISATNRNLAERVARAEFREDLLYRLNLITIHLPPLRERPSDIGALAKRFLEETRKVYDRQRLSMSPAAVRWLEVQTWPGNIRQLKHIIERTVLLSGKDALQIGDFQLTLETDGAEDGRDRLPQVGSMTIDEIEKAMILKSVKHHSGNISKVAESLGLSRAALYRRFEKYGIKM